MGFIVETLSLPQVREVYRRHMTADFPDDERKPLTAIEAALRRGEYRCFGALRNGEVLAYAFFVCLEGLWLFDYLAVLPALRGAGLGSAFLTALRADHMAEADCVLLEVDDPDAAEDPAERETRLRRLRFYLHNGLTDTGLTAEVWHVQYRILEIPLNGRHTAAETRGLYDRLYRAIMPGPVYRRMVHIH